MATPAERFTEWLANFQERLKEIWGTFVSTAFRGGLIETVDHGREISVGGADSLENSLREQLKPLFQRLRDTEGLPDDTKSILDKAIEEPGWIHLAALMPYLIGMLMGMGMGAAAPLANIGRYFLDSLIGSARLDPGTITGIYNRDRPKWDKLWKDLTDLGFTEDRIDIFKELANIVPPLSDMVRFADFGSFDPEIIEMWREFYDAPDWIAEPMSLLGVTGEWANKYWFSHWIQPGRYELGELHARELVDDTIVKNAYRTMGYSPYWQDKLLELVKRPWTRVDVRRMWDMGTIDEAQLRKAYHTLGYYDEWLDGMILWTKVYVAFPDLIARFKNGWIDEGGVRSELSTLGMPDDRIETMIQTKIKNAQPERVQAERTATATEIMKAVKKELITWAEGVERLTRMGYSAEEADFKLKVYIGVAEGSPETYMEFVDLTERYRQAIGLPAKIPPAELIESGKALREAEISLKEAKDKGIKNEKLAPYQKAASDATYRYRQLLTKWKAET